MQEVLASLRLFQPELALTAGLLLVVVVDAIAAPWRDRACFAICAATLVVALLLTRPLAAASGTPLFDGMLVLDPLGVFFKVLLIGAALLVVVTFRSARELAGLGMGEFHSLMLAVTLSNLLLAAANPETEAPPEWRRVTA